MKECDFSNHIQVEMEIEKAGCSQTVRMKVELKKECQFGDSFLIVGDDPILGSWNPSHAIPLNWSEGHIWSLLLVRFSMKRNYDLFGYWY